MVYCFHWDASLPFFPASKHVKACCPKKTVVFAYHSTGTHIIKNITSQVKWGRTQTLTALHEQINDGASTDI